MADKTKQKIEWLSWGRTAFETAQQRQLPIFLYLHTDWGHAVHRYEAEVLGDEEVVRAVNESFVPVRVDALRRPDVFDRYQQGGWPSVCLLAPGGELLYGLGATGAEGLRTVLAQITSAWRERRDEILKQIEEAPLPALPRLRPTGEGSPAMNSLDSIRQDGLAYFDTRFNGFGRAPKYPHSDLLLFLLEDPSDDLRQLATLTLETMRRSALHDVLGGGFFRACEDEAWRLPSFEKIFSDNAGLLEAYVEAHRQLGDEAFAGVAARILSWMEGSLGDSSGLFHAAQDGDAEPGRRGDYYGWSEEEIREAAPDEEAAAALLAHLGISRANLIPGGDGRYYLEERVPLNQLAMRLGKPLDTAKELLDQALAAMKRVRAERKDPDVDAGFLTSVQGRAMGALAQAAIVLERPRFLQRAFEIADILRERARDDSGCVVHEVGDEVDTIYLADQVDVIQGLLDLYRVAGRARDLLFAVELAEAALEELGDEEGIGCLDHRARDREYGLVKHLYSPFDGNARLLRVLAQIAALTQEESWHTRALSLLTSLEELRPQQRLQDAPFGRALRLLVQQPLMVDLLTGDGIGELRRRLLLEAPAGTLFRAFDPDHETPWTRLENYPSNGSGARAVVYAGGSRFEPTDDADLALLHLNEHI